MVNAARVHVTGNKREAKTYERYSGYPGGLRSRTFEELIARRPEEPLREAVRGMLQHNTLGGEMLKRLKVYAGAEHKQQAQQPVPIRFNPKGDIESHWLLTSSPRSAGARRPSRACASPLVRGASP